MRPLLLACALFLFSAPLTQAESQNPENCPSKMSGINSKKLVTLCLKTRSRLEEWRDWLVDQKVSKGAPVFRISKRSGKNIVIAVLPRAVGISDREFIVSVKSLQGLGIELPRQEGLINSVSEKKGRTLSLETRELSPPAALKETLDSWRLLRIMAQSEKIRLSKNPEDENSVATQDEFKRLVRLNRFLEALAAAQKRLTAENNSSERVLKARHVPKNINSPTLSHLKNVWRSKQGNILAKTSPYSIGKEKKPPFKVGDIQLRLLDPDRKISNIPSPSLQKRRLQMQKAVRKAFFGTPHWNRLLNGQGPNPFKNWANCVSNSPGCR